jgi:spermidine/putrescine transport system substrate-binding protein
MAQDRDRPATTAKEFMHELGRYRRGSVTRRHFLRVTRLGMATAVLAGAVPLLRPSRAYAAGELGDTLNFTTWPNHFDQANLDKFTGDTGVNINVTVFGSNEEMLAKLQAGGTGRDVFVPTNYTISTYKNLDLIDPLDVSKLPNFDETTHEARSSARRRLTARYGRCPRTREPPAMSSTRRRSAR